MPLRSISLPDFSIAHKTENVELTATGCLDVDIPEHCGNVRTSIELEDLVHRNHLWIARIGSCFFDVNISVNGVRMKREDQLSYIRDMVLGHEVWGRLGLRLVDMSNSGDECLNRVRLSIQHPDLSSAWVPDTTVVAKFHSVSYAITISRVPRRETLAKGRSKVDKGSKGAGFCFSKMAVGLTDGGNMGYNDLTLNDQKAVDEFIEQVNLRNVENESSRRPKRRRNKYTLANETIYATYTKDMLEICLENIMIGVRRCPRYLKFTDRSAGKALSQLVPAVFNMSYLRDISHKKAYLFTIATSLARMTGAESPSLRRKLEEFNMSSSEENSGVAGRSRRDLVKDGLESSLWSLMASETRASRR